MNTAKVKVELFPHNQITFESIMDLCMENSRICVPQATGTGKTFLEARILEEFSESKGIIFAPRNEILDETIETLSRFGITNSSTMTYQTFNNMSEDEIRNMNVDVILFDEAHRILAPEWNKNIQILIDTHPSSKIFGFTATPIRLDGKDVRTEVFNDCSTHYITLGEAIVRDIVKMPVYVSALYTLSDVIEELNNKITKSKNAKEEKKLFKKAVEEARRHLEMSCGVPIIIKKYFEDYNGKYLVFCKNTEHLEESIDMVEKWFREAGYDGNIFKYRIGSYYNDSDEQLTKFKKDNRDGLKLLFSIEKLNEGVHIPTVDGVILLRPTISNIIYYQQIGRCIRADGVKRPLILDLVNNIHGIKIPLRDDIEKCIKIRKDGGYTDCESDFEISRYNIVDYLEKTANSFSEIENQLIGLSKDWTEEEDDIIRKYYSEEGSEVYKRLKGRTKAACFNRAKILGVSKMEKGRPWTKEDDEILRNKYPIIGTKVGIELNRTVYACVSRAKELGITYNAGSNKHKYIEFRSGKWRVGFWVDGKRRSFGSYESEEEAIRVAREKAIEYGKAI